MHRATLVLWLWMLVVAISGDSVAAASQVVTIVIKSQPAAALVDVVRPLLGESGGVSAFHDKLIVRGTPKQIASVRALLKDIDRPPRRLVIEVRQSGKQSTTDRRAEYGARAGAAQVGRPPRQNGARIRYRDARTRIRDDSTQRVQALDGRPAFIRSGQSAPVYRAQQRIIGNQLEQGFDISYRDTGSGFYAVPRVHGDQVTIEVLQRHERAAQSGRFSTQRASSVLRGALGQWLTLGAIGGTEYDNRGSFGRSAQTRRAQDRRIELRVIALD